MILSFQKTSKFQILIAMIQFQKTNFNPSSQIFDDGLRKYMVCVYNNMFIALIISALTSLFVANSPSLLNAIFGSPLKWVVMLAPLGFVFFLSAKINSLPANTAKNYLWIFAGLMGLSLAPIFIMYTGTSVVRCFFISASVFGVASLYGQSTKKDLTSIGSFLFMGVIGIIIASLVNIFMQSSFMQLAISCLAVIIFTGLTAYDTQKLKQVYYSAGSDEEAIKKTAIMGALNLYIDFINIFIHLLHLIGDRRQ
jgi:FtsH-binding integral membrane protein